MGTSHSQCRVPKTDSREIIIPFDEVLADLAKLQDEIPEGFTTGEMSEATGMGRGLCRKKIKSLVAMGRLEFAGRKKVMAIDGVSRPVPVYRLVNNEN